MEEGKQSVNLELFDSQVVQPALARSQPVGPIARSGRFGEYTQQSRAAPAKQLRMALLVARMAQKVPAQ